MKKDRKDRETDLGHRRELNAFDIGLIVTFVISLSVLIISAFMCCSGIDAVKIIGIVFAVISGVILFIIAFMLYFFYL